MKDYFVITKIHRDDLDAAGFDASNVSDATMETLARKMGDDYITQLFWEHLDVFAKELGIPESKKKKKKKKEDDDIVTVTCYNKTEKMTRRDALNFYLEAMRNSEGSENERYETIFFQLLDGATEASDTL